MKSGKKGTMVHYRRNLLPGGTYFFTVTLKNRNSSYLTDHINVLRDSFRYVQKQYPFKIIASVVLPEHLHTVLELPRGDVNFPGRWRMIKSYFTRSLIDMGVDLRKNSKGEYNLWQRRYWEHTINCEGDLHRHIDYIHFNPLKHGLVLQVKDWPYSSFHRYVKQGVLELDWGGVVDCGEKINYGE